MRTHCVLVWGACLLGCGGRLDNPNLFLDPEAAFPCAIDDAQVVAEIVRPRCATSGCHDVASGAAALDLETPDAPSRMLGVSSSCAQKPLVDDKTPFAGYIVEKLGDEPTCGSRMPLGGAPLSATDKRCVQRWLGRLWAPAEH